MVILSHEKRLQPQLCHLENSAKGGFRASPAAALHSTSHVTHAAPAGSSPNRMRRGRCVYTVLIMTRGARRRLGVSVGRLRQRQRLGQAVAMVQQKGAKSIMSRLSHRLLTKIRSWGRYEQWFRLGSARFRSQPPDK